MRVLQWATLVAWTTTTVRSVDLMHLGFELETSEPPSELVHLFPNHVVVENGEKFFFVYDLNDISPDLPDLDLGSSDDEADEPQTP